MLVIGAFLGSSQTIQEGILVPWCEVEAAISEYLMNFFGGGVVRAGAELLDSVTGEGIVVLWACSGADATFILLAAIFVYPCSWIARLKGCVAGFIAVQGMNILRIISLFYMNLWRADFFQFAHLYLWQGLLMLDVLVFMLMWLRWEHAQSMKK